MWWLSVALAGPPVPVDVVVDLPQTHWGRRPVRGTASVHGNNVLLWFQNRPLVQRRPYAGSDLFRVVEGSQNVLPSVDWDGDGVDEVVRLTSPLGPTLSVQTLSGTELTSITLAANGSLVGARIVDVDADGVLDIVAGIYPDEIAVFDRAGRYLRGARHRIFARPDVGQADGDAALEIITGDGLVLDGETLAIDAVVPSGAYSYLPSLFSDVDGDGMDETLTPTFGAIVMQDLDGSTSTWQVAQTGAFTTIDTDGDGAEEVLSFRNVSRDLVVLDGVTGRQRQVIDVGMHCRWMRTLEIPAGRFVLCDDGSWWVNLNSNTVVPPPIWATDPGEPHRVDLDADGRPEIVWTGDWLIVQDPLTLDVLSTTRHGGEPDEHTTFYDVDGDGAEELITTDDGISVWEWHGSGFSYSHDLINRGSYLNPTLGHANADGVVDVFHHSLGNTAWTDLRSGSSTTSLISATDILDLDGDGIVEMVHGPSGTIVSPQGLLLATTSRIQQVVPSPNGPLLFAGGAQGVQFLRYHQGVITTEATLVRPPLQAGLPYPWWAGGRLWHAHGTGISAWDPRTGRTWWYEGTSTGAPPLVVGDLVMFGQGTWQVWSLR